MSEALLINLWGEEIQDMQLKLVILLNMHFQKISHNGTFYVNSTTKYAVFLYHVHQIILNKSFFPGLWDTRMLV